MKLTFYFDVFKWSKPDTIYIITTPKDRIPGAKRYRVEMEIPDPAQPDETITVEPVEV